jgi:hypothetical protein
MLRMHTKRIEEFILSKSLTSKVLLQQTFVELFAYLIAAKQEVV